MSPCRAGQRAAASSVAPISAPCGRTPCVLASHRPAHPVDGCSFRTGLQRSAEVRRAARRRPFCVSRGCRRYGVSLLIRVDQLPSAARVPGPWLAPAQVPSRLSPVPPAKNGPPQVGVVAGVGDVLAGDPDRVAVDGGGAVVAPAGARRVADLRLVAREAVVLRGALAAGDDVPGADADVRVDRRVGRARVEACRRWR